MNNNEYKKIAQHLMEIDNTGIIVCKCCRLFDEFTNECCLPQAGNCVNAIAKSLEQMVKTPSKIEQRNYVVGDIVIANGVGKIVLIAQHHKNNDENDKIVQQYVVQYPNGLLEIRTNASLKLANTSEWNDEL